MLCIGGQCSADNTLISIYMTLHELNLYLYMKIHRRFQLLRVMYALHVSQGKEVVPN